MLLYANHRVIYGTGDGSDGTPAAGTAAEPGTLFDPGDAATKELQAMDGIVREPTEAELALYEKMKPEPVVVPDPAPAPAPAAKPAAPKPTGAPTKPAPTNADDVVG